MSKPRMFFLHLALCLLATMANAAPLPRSDLPDALKSWVPWVLDGEPGAGCPHLFDNAEVHYCAWPGTLSLKAQATGASFAQDWQVYRESWVGVPGDAQHWPLEVSVDGKPAVVLGRDGVPSVRLAAGTHRLAGQLVWAELPESLALPPSSALIQLELAGRVIDPAARDEENRLWLQRKALDADGADQAQLRVYRKLVDGVPLRVETRLHLEVSGRNRELVLGRALLPDFIPQALNSPLPAVLAKDGSLKVQARAGTWDLVFVARHPGAAGTLTLPAADGLLAEEEIWVFQAAPLLRSVSVEGPSAIDPQQSTLPADWRSLPAYLMPSSTRFGLKELRRGDSDATPDRLTLERRLWLSFDGRLLTAQDRLQGEIGAARRLTMGGQAQLGRVDVDGQEQLITRGEEGERGEGGEAGIEIKRGKLRLSADSLLPDAPRAFPAIGWQQDVDHLSIHLALPAGWRLLHAGGADRVEGAWLARWNLLDIFLVIVIALALGRLWGRRWGAVALVLLTLTYHEPEAPRLLWLALLAATALLRQVPPGSWQVWLRRIEKTCLLLLVLVALGFATTQVRSALYPALEETQNFGGSRPFLEAQPAAVAPESPVASAPAAPSKTQSPESREPASSAFDYAKSAPRARAVIEAKRAQPALDPNARVQTGPGLPDWRWHEYRLVWSGPVRQEQALDLWLLSPAANRLLTAIRLILLAALLLRIAGLPWRAFRGAARGGATACALFMVLALAGMLLPASVHAQLPDNELLGQLREKLLRPPDCLPECAEITRLSVQTRGAVLRLVLEIDAALDTALPLPGGDKHWLPREARLDGRIAHVQRDDEGNAWLLAPAGRHRVELEGALPARDTVQLPLPRKPRHVEVQAAGWEVAGLSEETGAADTLQLTRRRKAQSGGEAPVLPPFLRVERRLILDLVWRVETTVHRDSPSGVPAIVEIPLLPGEAVATSGVNVKDGKVLVNLGPQADALSWSSTLEQSPAIQLAAANTAAWVETWVVAASTVWHLAPEGIPPVMAEAAQGADLAFQPWPGERLTLKITRPAALPGQTLTIDQSTLTVTPGAREADYRLSLLLRSSRAAEHSLQLPEGARLQQVSIDGQVRSLRANGRQLLLPIAPGKQKVDIVWRIDQAMQASYSTQSIDLALPGVNSHLNVQLPQDRWLLMTAGSGLGPAILYWGVLLVMLAAAFALGRVPGLPLQTRQWVLLALGLTQVAWWAAAMIAGWFFILAARRTSDPAAMPRWLFNLRQLALVLLTLLFLGILFYAVHGGLLGRPEMQVAGSQSSASLLHWYLDHAPAELPAAWILSLPMLAYRSLMLLWALWLAWSLLGWLKWGWHAFGQGGLWRRKLKDRLQAQDNFPE